MFVCQSEIAIGGLSLRPQESGETTKWKGMVACMEKRLGVVGIVVEDNSVSGSPLVAKPCSLHPGNVIGTVISPITGGTTGTGQTAAGLTGQIDTGQTDATAEISAG